MNNKRIYLDYASSTPVDNRVLQVMQPYWQEIFANPWSAHSDAEKAREALDDARKSIGAHIGMKGAVHEGNLVFTSGGTESNTLALKGALDFLEGERGSLAGLHVILGSIEHPSVLELREYASMKGMDIDYAPVTEEGVIDIERFKALLRPQTVLVSIQYVNSEIGTIQPLSLISKSIRYFRKHTGARVIDKEVNVVYPLFHSDASQAGMWLPVDVEELGVDMLTLDGHKIYGPKGIGALYVKEGTPISGIFLGSEGKRLRTGTPPIPLVVGFKEALVYAFLERKENVARAIELRDYTTRQLHAYFPYARINGSLTDRVANNISVTFPHINHEFLQVQLDTHGISVATRSACLEQGGEGSFVLLALGKEEKNALRISFGKGNTKEEVDRFISILRKLLLDQGQ